MTNKEAIEILKDLWRWEHPNWLEKDIRQALEKGIEALENQKSVIEELEKIKEEIEEYGNNANVNKNEYELAISQTCDYISIIIDNHIKELKGENNE